MAIDKENTDHAVDLRTVAEEKVAVQASANGTLDVLDVKRLYHELQIHQVELEMQNTELIRTKLDLEATRDSYFSLYDLAPVGYLTLNKDGLIQRANLTAATMLGLKTDDLINRPIQKFIFRDDIDSYYLQSRSAVESAEELHLELRFVKADGSPFWLNLQASLQNDDELWIAFSDISDRKQLEQSLRQANDTLEEQVAKRTKELATAVASLQQEITERKQAEEALRESEERFRALTIASSDSIYRMSPDWSEMFHLDGRSFIADTEKPNRNWLQEYIHPDDQLHVKAVINEAIRTKSIFELVHRVLRVDGTLGWTFSRAIPMLDANGKIVEWFGAASDITGRKQAEEAVRQSEALYRGIGESIDYGVWVCAPNGRNTYASESFLKMIGITQEQCSNFGWGDVLHPDDADRTIAAWQECVRTGGMWDIEHRFRGVDGQWHHVLARGVPVKNEQGEVTCWAGINLDIDRLRQVEENLRESEKQFIALADSIPNLAWWTNADGYITWYNRRWYEYTGTTLEEMEGWGWQSVHDPSTLPRVMEQWQKSISTGQPFDMEFPLRRADGVYRTFLTRSIPMKDSRGNVVRWFGTNTDISALKEVEEKLKQSEERHRLLAETMLQGVVYQDANGRIISMNPAAERILGKSHEEFLGNSSFDVVHDTIRENGELFPGLENPTMVALRTGLTVRSVVMGVFNPKLQEYRWIGIDAVPVFSPGEDRPSEVYSIFEDITERKQAKMALQKAHDELEQRVTERTMELSATIDRLQSEIRERGLAEKKLREETAVRLQATEALREKERMLIQQSRQAAMGEMIGNIAHQWRQPLNTLGLYTQGLGVFYGSPDFNKEFLDNSIAKSMEIIAHMSKTIDDFRDYFKPEKEKTDFFVVNAIKSSLSLLEGNFNNPKITIDLVVHDNPVVNGYQNEFAQVFLNILNNARDAIIERDIADARITITICSENNCATVTVTDNAGGIPDEVINKVFDPYFTTKGPQLGTGIGLFMSKTIIEKNMGGRLTVRNTDTGAEFRIEVGHGTQI